MSRSWGGIFMGGLLVGSSFGCFSDGKVTRVVADAGGGGGQAGGSSAGQGGGSGSGGQGGVTSGGQGGGSSGGSAASSGGGGVSGSGGQGGSSGQGAGSGGTSGSGGQGGSAGGSGGIGGSGGSGTLDSCASTACGSGQYCGLGDQQCYCLPGYVQQAGACQPILPGDPATHTETQVCDAWNAGHVVNDASPWTAGPTTCDPGTSSRDGINDALRRINMFRWLTGLGPTWDAPDLNETGRWCAVVTSYNPIGTVPNPHDPPASAMCYTLEGASGAASSHISWGTGIAQPIDQYMEDRGNVSTMGHRRWLVNPPLGPVGIGYYAGGGWAGSAQCTSVFGSEGSHPTPSWVSVPPPGYSPREIVDWTWTFHTTSSVANAQISVTRVSDGMAMSFTRQTLASGYGQNSISFIPGFSSVAGETYNVEISGVQGGTISYQVKPVDC